MTLRKLLKLGDHLVPGIWGYLLPEEFTSQKFPKECEATCSNCPEIKDSGFRPDYRCCTFQPRISNYMIGLAWTDQGATSVKTLEQMLDNKMLLPEGLIASPKRWSLFLDDQANDLFGKSSQVLCHFLNTESGKCGIYNYRNGPCSTFFCRHDQGDQGEEFWDHLMIYINQVDHALSQWVLKELGIIPERYFGIFDQLAKEGGNLLEQKTEGWPDEILSKVWGDWYGKEVEFYRASAELIERNLDSLKEIAGSITPIESRVFEKSIVRQLPAKSQEQVDDCDQAEGKLSSLEDLYRYLKYFHRELGL